MQLNTEHLAKLATDTPLSEPKSAQDWLSRLICTPKQIEQEIQKCIEENLRLLETARGTYRKALRRRINRQVLHLAELYHAINLAAS